MNEQEETAEKLAQVEKNPERWTTKQWPTIEDFVTFVAMALLTGLILAIVSVLSMGCATLPSERIDAVLNQAERAIILAQIAWNTLRVLP